MSSDSQENTQNYKDGPEQDYTDCVHVLIEPEVIQPGCTKIKHISIKPVMVKLIFSTFIASFLQVQCECYSIDA